MEVNDFGELADLLLVQAKELGICEKGLRRWDRGSEDNMIRLWVDNIDFALQHDWPSLDCMELFDRRKMANWGVWLDHEFADGNWELPYGGRMVLNGTCTGVLRFRGWQVATVYVRHDSDVRVEAHDHARVQVRVYDNAKLTAKHYGATKISLFPRSDKCTVCSASDELYHEYFDDGWGS